MLYLSTQETIARMEFMLTLIFAPMKSKWRKKTGELMAETGCTVNHSKFVLLFRSVWMEMASESANLRPRVFVPIIQALFQMRHSSI